jgi:hypothetical protein
MKPGEFLRSIGVSFRFVAAGPNVIDGVTPFKYKVTLSLEEREFTSKFRKGAAYVGEYRTRRSVDGNDRELVRIDYHKLQEILKKYQYGERSMLFLHAIPPNLDEFAESIQLDLKALADGPMWEDFAANFDYNSDSIHDRKVWRACCKAYRRLRRMLGYTHFANFLACQPDD